MEEDIETWRVVVEHWKSQGRDLAHLEVPPELALQLGVPADKTRERRNDSVEEDLDSEDQMAKKNAKQTKKSTKVVSTKKPTTKKRTAPKVETAQAASEPTPVATETLPVGPSPQAFSTAGMGATGPTNTHTPAGEYQPLSSALVPPNPNEPKWKKRSTFTGDDCGYSGCARRSDGYVPGIRSTKEGERDQRSLWFGPACISCVRKYHPDMKPLTLAELAHQRNGVSDLALALDIEVGDVHKRLLAAGIDEKGRPLNGQAQVQGQGDNMQQNHVPQAQAPQIVDPNAPPPAQYPIVAAQQEQHSIAVVVPYDVLAGTRQEMATTMLNLASFYIRSQPQMDYASSYMQRVKGLWKEIDELRKSMARPFNEVVDRIQEHFKPALADLKAVEADIKSRIDEGMAWATQQAAQSFQAAQQALATGNQQGVALATQQAMSADLSLSQGVSMRPKICFEISDPSQLPGNFWSPDRAKVQEALNAMDQTQLHNTLNAGYTPIAGCRVWIENTVASRAA